MSLNYQRIGNAKTSIFKRSLILCLVFSYLIPVSILPTHSRDGDNIVDEGKPSGDLPYGTSGQLNPFDKIRISRPTYTEPLLQSDKATSQPVTGNKASKLGIESLANISAPGIGEGHVPKVAPNIVEHSKPKIAPPIAPPIRQSNGSDSSNVRIERPEYVERSKVPQPNINQVEQSKDSQQSNKTGLDKQKNVTPPLKATEGTSSSNQPQLIKQTPKLAPVEDLKRVTTTQEQSSQNDATASGVNPAGALDLEKYPAVGRLEILTFGKAAPEKEIAQRLGNLETSIFAKTYVEDSLFDRTERLKRTLLGAQAYDQAMSSGNPDPDGEIDPALSIEAPIINSIAREEDFVYLDEMAKNPENLQAQPANVLQAFAEELINFERSKRSLEPLQGDTLIQKMADNQMVEMLEMRQISHSDQEGRNPDRRYTLLGGLNSVSEGLASVSTADLTSSNLTKASVCFLIKKMLLRQDDREALLSPEATNLASSFGRLSGGTKIFACTEVLTKRAKIDRIDFEAKLGDKIEVEGEIFKPYQFDRITLAWEEALESPMEEEPGSDEALPYFPPLDYIAYDTKSERDHSKAITALKALGVVAAIAGGMFVPPVALAAPLIMMTAPGASELRPQSDIPIKGGVKLNGSSFKVHLPLDNEGQKGLYYITVWAIEQEGTRPFAVSRRAILVKGDHDETNKKKDPSQEKTDSIEYTNDSGKEKDPDKFGQEGKAPDSIDEANDKDNNDGEKPGI